mmetsp:Transcript_51697/g.149084  ORF Transcript_51697/g.149084 Transcript_51697/m.149084 type:complete len:214 (+) Transcript_51697:316-957(+)
MARGLVTGAGAGSACVANGIRRRHTDGEKLAASGRQRLPPRRILQLRFVHARPGVRRLASQTTTSVHGPEAEQRRREPHEREDHREEGHGEEQPRDPHEDEHGAEEQEARGTKRGQRRAEYRGCHVSQRLADRLPAAHKEGRAALPVARHVLAVLVGDMQCIGDAVADEHDQAKHLDRPDAPGHWDTDKPHEQSRDTHNREHHEERKHQVRTC